jgi:hypothetical protein
MPGNGEATGAGVEARERLAKLAYADAEYSEATALYERVLAISERAGVLPIKLAAPRFGLARALWHGAADRERARDLALMARDAYRQHLAVPSARAALTEIERWLEATRTP